MAPEPGDTAPADARRKPARRRLPGHLPRETVVHPAAAACPHCGGAPTPSARIRAKCSNTCPVTSRWVEHSARRCRAGPARRSARRRRRPCRSSAGRPGPGLLSHPSATNALRLIAAEPTRHCIRSGGSQCPAPDAACGRCLQGQLSVEAGRALARLFARSQASAASMAFLNASPSPSKRFFSEGPIAIGSPKSSSGILPARISCSTASICDAACTGVCISTSLFILPWPSGWWHTVQLASRKLNAILT